MPSMSSSELQQLEFTIQGLESQRALLGDVVTDAALGPLRSRLATLRAGPAVQHPAQVLKHVTILFMDVVGSTSLAQHLDAEEVSAVMDGTLSRGTAVVEAHRGKVLQYAGDSILAAFGADRAAEDDVERAVRCGLALLNLGKALRAEVQAAHGHTSFDFRVGIHSGDVLLGGRVDEEGTIHGIAVNIAARMEQSAPPGGLRISHETYAQVRGVFDVEPQPPLLVKGVDAPLRTYLVLRARPRAFRVATRGIEGVETRMIGREVELQALQAAFECVMAPGAGLQRVLREQAFEHRRLRLQQTDATRDDAAIEQRPEVPRPLQVNNRRCRHVGEEIERMPGGAQLTDQIQRVLFRRQ